MKHSIVKILLLIFSIYLISARKSKTKSKDLPKNNKFIEFIKEAVSKLKGKADEKTLKVCVPTTWIGNSDDDLAKQGTKMLTDFVSKFDKFYTSLNNKLDKPCEFKPKVKEALRKTPPLTFIQVNSRTNALRSKSHSHSHSHSHSRMKRSKRSKQMPPFGDLMKAHAFVVNAALNDFFKSEFYVTCKNVLQCFQSQKDAPPEYRDKITNFLRNIEILQSGTDGFIDTIVDALCNWKDFKETLMVLGQAKLEKDEIKRWKLYGTFYKNLIATFGTKN